VDIGLADAVTCPWPAENIPDADSLFKRVRRTEVADDGWPKLNVFVNRGSTDLPDVRPGLSTDWSKYSTPEQTRARSRRAAPEEYGVIFFIVGDVRELPFQEVEHTPVCRDPELADDPNNRAHTDIFGPKTRAELAAIISDDEAEARGQSLEIRAELHLMCNWLIPPPSG
jgi:hypothetical protein